MPLNHSPLNRCGVRDGTESDAVDLSQFYIVDEATNASPILPYIPNALRGADSMGAIASQPKMSGNEPLFSPHRCLNIQHQFVIKSIK